MYSFGEYDSFDDIELADNGGSDKDTIYGETDVIDADDSETIYSDNNSVDEKTGDADHNSKFLWNKYFPDDNFFGDKFDLYNNTIKHEICNIEKTIWFSSLKNYPCTIKDMTYFINQLDMLRLFNLIDVNLIPKYSAKKLDSLFLLLKLINTECVKYCEYVITTYFIEEFEKIFYLDIYSQEQDAISAFLESIYTGLSAFFINFLTTYYPIIIKLETKINYKEAAQIIEMTNTMIDVIKWLFFQDSNKIVLDTYNIVISNDFFAAYFDRLQSIIIKIVIFTKTKMSHTIEFLSTIVTQFLDDVYDETLNREGLIHDTMYEKIGTFLNITKFDLFASDAVDITISYFNKRKTKYSNIVSIHNYKNFLYTSTHKSVNRMHISSLKKKDKKTNNAPSTTPEYDNAITSVNAIGMTIRNKIGLGNLLSVFLRHKLVDSTKQLANIIVKEMETRRCVEYMLDKDDQTDLETKYLILCMTHNIEKSYDTIIEELKKYDYLLVEYPVEFFLKLISRILNVKIIFYDYNLTETIIKNYMYDLYDSNINIYQSIEKKFYILYPLDTTFKPVGSI